MPRKRNELAEQAKELFFQESGRITPREIAHRLGVKPEQVRRWKSAGKWDESEEKSRGGAPKGNTNAETHGAFSRPRLDLLSDDVRQELSGLRATFEGNALQELKRLLIKRADLERRIMGLQDVPQDTAELLDRTMVMMMSDGKTIRYTNRSSAFSRQMTLEAELNRVDGRIIKLLDSIKSHEAEVERLKLDRERLEFSKQKARGVFNFDDETGKVVPEDDEDEIIEE